MAGGGGGASRFRKAARKILLPCGSFSSRRQSLEDPAIILDPTTPTKHHHGFVSESTPEEAEMADDNIAAKNNLCAICLDPLSFSNKHGQAKAIFTAQCSHAFHLACISSNVRHGSVSCPICRAHWTQLPRATLNPALCSTLDPNSNYNDPILRIIDDSIATLRLHRRSVLRAAPHYNYDGRARHALPNHPTRPHVSPVTSSPCRHHHTLSPPVYGYGGPVNPDNDFSVELGGDDQQAATDLVLVASPTVPHLLRQFKQSMAMVVRSLRPVDRLAIVIYTWDGARAFPFRRMTSYGKRTALLVVDRLLHAGQPVVDPTEGLEKAIKLIEASAHRNPHACILHLFDDIPSASYYHNCAMANNSLQYHRCGTSIHWFHVGLGFGSSNTLVVDEFQEFLRNLLEGLATLTRLQSGEAEETEQSYDM